jgi:hypothetical protein
MKALHIYTTKTPDSSLLYLYKIINDMKKIKSDMEKAKLIITKRTNQKNGAIYIFGTYCPFFLSRLPSEDFPDGWHRDEPKKCMDAVQFLLSGPLKASMAQVKGLLENAS